MLRIYRDARGPERAHREGSVQNAVGALGFPTPRILLTCLDRAVLGGAFLIMQRVPGRVMLDALFGPRLLRMPGLLRGVATVGRRWIVDRYLRAYRARRGLDLDAVRYYEGLRCLGMLIEAGEHVRARAGLIAPIAKPTAFSDPRVIGALRARFRAISGVDASLVD